MNPRELAAAYLLDNLDDGARARVERRLAEDAELRAEVEAMQPLLGTLGALPAEAWPAPAESDEPTGAAREPAPERRRWSIRPALALGVLLAAVALGVGGGLLFGGGGDTTQQAPPVIVLRPLAPTSGESATVAMPRAGEMVLRTRGLPPTAAGQYYELWLMTDAERTVPVASFRVGADGRATVRVPLPADPAGYRYFDLSLQRVGAGTEHSADSVLRGPTA